MKSDPKKCIKKRMNKLFTERKLKAAIKQSTRQRHYLSSDDIKAFIKNEVAIGFL